MKPILFIIVVAHEQYFVLTVQTLKLLRDMFGALINPFEKELYLWNQYCFARLKFSKWMQKKMAHKSVL